MILDARLVADVLAELATRAADAGVEATVHVVGGAAIAIAYDADRDATRDVDAWLNADERSKQGLLAVAEQIAVERGWPSDWLNEQAVVFFPDSVGGKGSPDWRGVCEVGGVAVVVAGERILFAMKLHAARGRRDFPDLAVLASVVGVSSVADAEAVFDEYYPRDSLKPAARRWLTSFFGRTPMD